ncbi:MULTISPECIES: tyrosine-type recombinase/integrase [Leisingera]|jgi:integrase|uniref:tyrosine-type recombinase/integrase n=1 Tax=Leisingera TaxID=191028 RepID=UPI001154A896|nr:MULTISPECIES: site-specific integrase [Leisingera]QDI74675.1 site-specific integrase [Leisingera aquaemixtae]
MPRYSQDFLTQRDCERIKKPGRYFDGFRNGLYLNVSKPRGKRPPAKSWAVRYRLYGTQRDMGLGPLRLLPLELARGRAREIRELIDLGVDPLAQAEAEREGAKQNWQQTHVQETFKNVALEVFEMRRSSWTSQKHADKWIASLENYVFPVMGDGPIAYLGKQDVLEVLKPIWNSKRDTAQRVKQRMSAVFAYAIDTEKYHGPNPCDISKDTLPSVRPEVEHRKAMPWPDLPAFMVELKKRRGMSARCLEFLILTGTRSGEARGARWDEIEGDVWTVPKERMKMKREHRIPLSPQAQAILKAVRAEEREGDLIFPSPQGKRQSDVVFAALYKRMGRTDFTTHGFRTTFKTWAQENSPHSDEISELNLAHVVGSKVRNAYARSDLFEQRRSELAQWAQHAFQQVC